MDSIETNTLADAVEHKIFRLRSILQEYETELGNGKCREFLNGILFLVDAVEEAQADWLAAFEEAKSRVVREARAAHVRTNSLVALRVLSNIHEHYLPLLQAASNDQDSYLLQPILSRAISLIGGAGPSSEVALVPTFDFAYGFNGMLRFVSGDIGKLEYFDQAKKARRLKKCRQMPKVTAFVTFPIIDKDSALKMTAVAHELAHFADYIRNISNQVLDLGFTFEEKSFDALVTERARVEHLSDEEAEAACFEGCFNLLTLWLQETIADLIAIRILGPAFALSFIDFLRDAAISNVSDAEHPAPAKRLALMFDELEDLGYFSVKHGLQRELGRIRGSIKSEAERTFYDGEFHVVDRTIEQNNLLLLSIIRTKTANYSYTASRYLTDVPSAVRDFARGVCPIETSPGSEQSRAISAVAVLNAAWEVYTVRLDAFNRIFTEGTSRNSAIKNLNQLVFKALEGGEILRLWKEAKVDADTTAK